MLEIMQHPHSVLYETAVEIPADDILSKKIQTLIFEMKETLRSEDYGVAIAAPQVGTSLRLFIVSGRVFAADESEAFDSAKHPDLVCINPTIVTTSRKTEEMQEGCLSVRGKWGKVARAEKVTLKALDEKGETFSRGASGLLAQIFQHEMDHLNGILYIDKATDIWDDEKEEKENEPNDHEKA